MFNFDGTKAKMLKKMSYNPQFDLRQGFAYSFHAFQAF